VAVPFEVKDLAGVSEPTKKLIEVVSRGIGTMYRPRALRNEADAKAYEIRVLAAAEAESAVVKAHGQAQADLERIRSLAAGDPEILERARIRLLSREVEGQLNVEAIAEHALTSLPINVSSQPVADDWRRKFFLEAENICDRDLQLLWGKILAGEVTSPGSYSLRTLEVLKHLLKSEAELFRKACNIAFRDGSILMPGHDVNVALEPYGLPYPELLSLRDAGLLHQADDLIRQFTNPTTPILTTILINNGILMELSGQALQHVRIPSLPFTRAGQELQNLMGPNPCMPYLKSVATFLRGMGLTVKKATETTSETGQTIRSFVEDF
jgi:hypothetical protein